MWNFLIFVRKFYAVQLLVCRVVIKERKWRTEMCQAHLFLAEMKVLHLDDLTPEKLR